MKLTKVLNNTAGRFTTLIVNRANGQTSHCAKVQSVTDNYVYFLDVNTYQDRRVRPDQVVFARSGSQLYRR